MIHNAIAYGVSVPRALARAVGIDELAEGTSRLGETLQPVIDAWTRAEWSFLREERLFSQARDQPAAVGVLGGVRIRNPGETRTLVVLTRLVISSNLATSISIRKHTTDTSLGNEVPVVTRDSRWANQNGRALTSRGTAATIGDEIGKVLVNVATGGIYEYEKPVVLAPASALDVELDVTNVRLIVTFIGYEREGLPGELD